MNKYQKASNIPTELIQKYFEGWKLRPTHPGNNDDVVRAIKYEFAKHKYEMVIDIS